MSAVKEIVLTFSCQDSKGLVAAVATLFATLGFNIKESSQFEDVERRRFFMRNASITQSNPLSNRIIGTAANRKFLPLPLGEGRGEGQV